MCFFRHFCSNQITAIVGRDGNDGSELIHDNTLNIR